MKNRVYRHTVDSKKYPDYPRRAVKAVTREALDNTVQFTSARWFSRTGGAGMMMISDAADDGCAPLSNNGSKLVGVENVLYLYAEYFHLGKVFWPDYPILFTENFRDLVDSCAEHGYYLYDFYGFVPGSKGRTDMWGEYRIPPEYDRYLCEKLGDHFLGYDNGEQDGRYVHALAREGTPTLNSRKMQYRNFQSYFEKLNNTMNNHTVTLASLTYLHYFAREGNTILIGAETAQGLQSNTMWFSFIRGASKQYGLLHYGNASIYNRWGVKGYRPENVKNDVPDDGAPCPKIGNLEYDFRAGTSLSLLRRLIYNQYMYNCDILGFENGWVVEEKAEPGDREDRNTCIIGNIKYLLTPIGEIQRGCAEFIEKHGTPGCMYTPIALIADSFAGWTPPRHLYTNDIYKSWGNLPYTQGDYQLHCLFSILYPGYENGSFYRDERGFLTPTPYGESADVLLSDVRSAVLNRYDTAVLVSDTELGLELYRKLKSFVSGGGHLVTFTEELTCATDAARADGDFDLFFEEGTHAWGQGRVTVYSGASALEPTGEKRDYHWRCNETLVQPYRFRADIEADLRRIFADTRILYVDNPALQYTLAVKDRTHYTLYVANNTLARESFCICSATGKIVSVTDWELGDDTTRRSEFLPRKKDLVFTEPVQIEGEYTIDPYDCRIFAIEAEEVEFEDLPESNPTARYDNLYLNLGYNCPSAKVFLLEHPTFEHHFGGLMLPAEYLDRLDEEAAEKEGSYFRLHKLQVMVDFTRMLNHYPDLTIIGNFPKRTEASLTRMEKILRKASCYGCAGAVFTLHRLPENEYSGEETLEGAKESLSRLKNICDDMNIPAYFSNRPLHIRYGDMDLAGQIGLTHCGKYGTFAYNTAFAAYERNAIALPEEAGLVLLADIHRDILGQAYAMYRPISGGENEATLRSVFREAKAKEMPIVLNAEYSDWDQVIQDLEGENGEFL